MIPKFFYELKIASFVDGFPYAFMDRNAFKLSAPARAADGDILVPLADLRKVFAPYMTINQAGDTVELDGVTAKLVPGEKTVCGAELAAAPELIDGALFVPALSLMGKVFGKKTGDSENNKGQRMMPLVKKVYAVSNEPEFKWDNESLSYISTFLKGKEEGELYKTFWQEEAQKITTYCMYVPYCYDPAIPTKLVICLHGGGLAEESIFKNSENMIQRYAERRHYILLCPSAGPRDSVYGCLAPGLGNSHFPLIHPDDPINPCGYNEEELSQKLWGQHSVDTALAEAKRDYNIDATRLYMMGNSMGGLGVFHYAAINPGMFKAIAPSGHCPDMPYFDFHRLDGLPIRLVAGTEDGGFLNHKTSYKRLKAQGLNVSFCAEGGAVHGNGWVRALEGTFDFFDANY